MQPAKPVFSLPVLRILELLPAASHCAAVAASNGLAYAHLCTRQTARVVNRCRDLSLLGQMWAAGPRSLALHTLQGGNRRVLRDQVRQAFRKNKDETDPQKIEEQKEA